jgi:hypothetical protein
MVETTQSIVADVGTVALPRLIAQGRGRTVAVHFGTVFIRMGSSPRAAAVARRDVYAFFLEGLAGLRPSEGLGPL